MKIMPAKQKAYIARPTSAVTLFFGPNSALVDGLAEKLMEQLKGATGSATVVEISVEQLKESEAVLFEKLSNFSLFDEPKIYFVPHGTDAIGKTIIEATGMLPEGCNLVVTAGDLTPKSSLRAFFEKDDKVASIACYDDEPASLQQEVMDQLAKSGIRIDRELADMLLTRIGNKRFALATELEKLSLYLDDQESVSEEAIFEVISAYGNIDFGDFSDALITSNYKKLYQALQEAENEGTQAISIIRGHQWYLLRLLTVRLQTENGAPFEMAVKSLQPPVFFKAMPVFRKHLNLLSAQAITAALKTLLELERNIKLQSFPAGKDAFYSELLLA